MTKFDRRYVSDEAIEKYEDARFGLIMEGYSTKLGEECIEENLRLQQDSSFEFPAELDRKCLKAINRAISRKKCRRNMEKVKKVARRITVFAASCLLVAVLSGVVLYNTVEAFRLSVVDYAIELFDIGDGSIVSVRSNDEYGKEVVPTWLPDGYELDREMNDVDIRMIKYSDGQNTITFTAHLDMSMGNFTVDTENALETYDIKIYDNNGVVVQKSNEVLLYWFENSAAYYIRAESKALDSIVRMAESCYE